MNNLIVSEIRSCCFDHLTQSKDSILDAQQVDHKPSNLKMDFLGTQDCE